VPERYLSDILHLLFPDQSSKSMDSVILGFGVAIFRIVLFSVIATINELFIQDSDEFGILSSA